MNKLFKLLEYSVKYPFKIRGYWKVLTHFHKNIVVGILIAFLLHYFHQLPYIVNAENVAMDWMMRINLGISNNSGVAEKKDKFSYVFIEIDDDTFSKWGEPYHTPRDKLTQLIEFASSNKAKSIIVDINLTRSGIDSDADQHLIDFIASYPVDSPPLILLRVPKKNKKGIITIKDSFIEIEAQKRNIYWGQPTFFKDQHDQTVRRWELLKIVCHNETLIAIPSVQLIIDMVNTGWQDRAKKLTSELIPTDQRCSNFIPQQKSIQYGEKIVTFFLQDQNQRLIYSIPSNPGKGYKNVDLEYRPAWMITENKTSQIVGDFIRNKIVIIGGSHAEGRDIFWTPVGEMPGSLIIINAIKSLSKYGQLKIPPWWNILLIEFSLIILMAWVYDKYSSFAGLLITGTAIISVLLPFSFYFFKLGVWIDFAGPLIGMQLHQFIAGYEEGQATKNKLFQLEEQLRKNPNKAS